MPIKHSFFTNSKFVKNIALRTKRKKKKALPDSHLVDIHFSALQLTHAANYGKTNNEQKIYSTEVTLITMQFSFSFN